MNENLLDVKWIPFFLSIDWTSILFEWNCIFMFQMLKLDLQAKAKESTRDTFSWHLILERIEHSELDFISEYAIKIWVNFICI